MTSSAKAYSVSEFCRQYSIGRTTVYTEVKAGRLRLRKAGKRSLIASEDAEAWIDSLPTSSSTDVPPRADARRRG